MRILTLNYEHPPLGGGGGVAAANLSRELVRLGHEVDYVTTRFPGASRQDVIDGVCVYRERVFGRRDLHTATIASMLAYPPVAIRRARRLARVHSYDVIHTHFAIPTGPAGYVLSTWLGLPNVLSVYGGDIYDPSKRYSPHAHPVLRRVVRAVLGQADLVVPESSDIARRVEEVYGTKTPVQIIPLGFDPPRFDEVSRRDLCLKDGAVLAVAIGRLIPRKGYGDLLRAFRAADVPGLELLIVGDGPEESALRHLANELRIAERVRFLGHLDEARKFQHLGVADFFVLASIHEGFGIAFQEAMHCGLPIVTTNAGGQVDFLAQGENALLTPPGDVEAMAGNIGKMACDAALRGKMARANRIAIQRHLTPSVARRYLDVYAQVVKRRSGRGRHR